MVKLYKSYGTPGIVRTIGHRLCYYNCTGVKPKYTNEGESGMDYTKEIIKMLDRLSREQIEIIYTMLKEILR